LRELEKAYIGFLPDPKTSKTNIAIGKWGFGAYNGDKELKFII
jgi:hypothetical protein